MPRKRMIDPSFWDDPDIAELQPLDRLLVIGMISHADDYGNLHGHPAILRKQVFGYDSIGVNEVRVMRDRIVETCRNIGLYSVDGQDYVHFIQWTKHQKMNYKAQPQWPQSPWESEEEPTEDNGQSDEGLSKDLGSSDEGLGKDCETREEKRRGVKRRKDKRREDMTPNGAGKPPKPPPDKPPREDQAMWGALLETCHIKRVTQKTRGQLNTLIKWLRGEGYTVGDVKNFALYWESDPWKKENRPMKIPLYSGSEFGAWVDAGKPLHANSSKGNGGNTSDSHAAINRAVQRIKEREGLT